MKPVKSILDRSFVYVPSTATSVDQTWRRYGWRPSNEEGRTRESNNGSAAPSSSAASARQ
jgi:hypothetical protein